VSVCFRRRVRLWCAEGGATATGSSVESTWVFMSSSNPPYGHARLLLRQAPPVARRPASPARRERFPGRRRMTAGPPDGRVRHPACPPRRRPPPRRDHGGSDADESGSAGDGWRARRPGQGRPRGGPFSKTTMRGPSGRRPTSVQRGRPTGSARPPRDASRVAAPGVRLGCHGGRFGQDRGPARRFGPRLPRPLDDAFRRGPTRSRCGRGRSRGFMTAAAPRRSLRDRTGDFVADVRHGARGQERSAPAIPSTRARRTRRRPVGHRCDRVTVSPPRPPADRRP